MRLALWAHQPASMKRDSTDRLTQALEEEPKERVQLSLTQTTWQMLEQQAQASGISCSELIEQYVSCWQTREPPVQSEQAGSPVSAAALPKNDTFEDYAFDYTSEASTAKRLAELEQANQQLQAQVLELQKTAEEVRSRETEERLSLVLEATNDAIYDRNLKTGSLWWNPAYSQLFGEQPPSTNTLEWWAERIHPEDRARVVSSFKAALAQAEEHWSAEYRYQQAGGGYADVVDRTYIVRDQAGNPERYLGAISNVTPLKQVEENLRQTEERLQLALSSAHTIAWDINLHTNQVVCSANALELWAVPVSTTEDFFAIVHPEDQPRLRQALERAITHQEYPIQEYRVIAPDQTLRWMSSRGQVYLDSQGQACRILGASVDISDRKQAEAALRISQEHYHLLVETLPQLICLSEASGKTTYCNQSWIHYTGLTLEATRNVGSRELFHPDDYPSIVESWQGAKLGNAYSLEFRLKRWDGVYRWHLGKGVPLRAENGTLVGWLATATDIDDQKQAEQRQQLLAQAAQTFAAASLDLQTVLDTITQLVSSLMGDVCVLSLRSEDGQQLCHASCHHPDPEVCAFATELLNRYPRRVDEGIGGRVMQTGEPLLLPVNSQAEFRAEIKPEFQAYLERFQVCSTLLVPLKAQGQTIGVLSLTRHQPANAHTQDDLTLLQDLAERAAMAIANAQLYQQAEQARQQAERDRDRTARLQAVTAALSESLAPNQVADVVANQTTAVLNAATVLVALVTPAGDELEIIHHLGEIEDITPDWRRFPLSLATPLTDAVRTGQPVWEETLEERIAHYPHLAEVYAQAKHPAWISLPLVVEGRAVGGMTLTFAQLPKLTLEDRAFMLSLAQQCGQAIARAQLYKAEQQARAQAVSEAERSAAANRTKDEFLAVLSHELRTPMNPILGWTKLLQRGMLDAERSAIALETIQRNAELQVQLIEDLLDVSRILQGKLSFTACPTDPALPLTAAIETVRLAVEAKTLQLHTHLDSDIGHVLGDATRLQQVIWNLLTNAIKFTPKGGKISVRLARVEAHAEIQVSDTGRGIQPDFLPYMFDTFRQADSSTTRTFGGLGLGLAITRHIVELHGGILWAESPGPGQGATFTVRLPLLLTPVLAGQEAVLANQPPSLKGVRLLVVDDEIDNLELARFILQQAGASVVTVSSATEALQSLSQTQPDILLVDIGMPQTDGYTLLQQVRALPAEKGGGLPAIALTSYAGESYRKQALAAGFQQHLAKPVTPENLLQAIANLLRLPPRP